MFYLQPKCQTMSSTNVTFKENILDNVDLHADISNITAMFDIELSVEIPAKNKYKHHGDDPVVPTWLKLDRKFYNV